jgi:hypothetical protein
MTFSTNLLLAFGAALLSVPALAALPPAEAWEVGPWVRGRNYSVGMPARPAALPDGSLAIEFPMAGRGQVDAMTVATGPLAGARRIILRYRIDAARDTRFVADERPDEPATVSLYFQRRGDTWSGRGRDESYRWYVPARAVMPLAPGVQTVTVELDENWTNVNGRSRGDDPEGFAAALADTGRIALAFGSASARSHGVYATGPARFTLLAFEIE